MTEKILTEKNLVVRHSALELIEHWAIAISGLVLLVTGIFELPVGKRYYIINVPGLGWAADFITSLYLHYAAALVFTAAALFHVFYHGLRGEKGLMPQRGDFSESITVIKSLFGFGKEPPMHKYLPEQRLAYVGMAFIILMLIVSGLVKTYKNIYAPDMSQAVLLWATWMHNIFFILFFLAFLAHMAAILLRPNWPMVRGIFTGKVRLDYARHRHSLWLAEMEPAREKPASATEEVPPAKEIEVVAEDTEEDDLPPELEMPEEKKESRG
ncbi:MAG: cytochrome b/b6 domain-containing protein [Smithella sp.]